MMASEEAATGQLALAENQGEALGKALHEMAANVAQEGKEIAAGNYLVGYAVEKPEGLYVRENGELTWQEPQDKNIHIEISVRDAGDGRFVPALDVELAVYDADDNLIGMHQQPFLWHPWLYHYGRNWKLPGAGQYTFHVTIDAPNFPRHDKKNGRRYADPVEITFRGVNIETGSG
jgi:uncharacterized protein involved in high-affinity Fe2+ transport